MIRVAGSADVFIFNVGLVSVGIAIAFVGFLVMLACAFFFERNLRKMGKAGWEELTQTVREKGFPNVLGDTRRRLSQRFKRDDSS